MLKAAVERASERARERERERERRTERERERETERGAGGEITLVAQTTRNFLVSVGFCDI